MTGYCPFYLMFLDGTGWLVGRTGRDPASKQPDHRHHHVRKENHTSMSKEPQRDWQRNLRIPNRGKTKPSSNEATLV